MTSNFGSILGALTVGCHPLQAKGHQDSYKQVYEGFQGALSYASGLIHHVKLKHLTPGHTYFYRCGDPAFPDQWSQVMNLTMPRATGPHQFPLRLGIIADIGQIMNSSGDLLSPVM